MLKYKINKTYYIRAIDDKNWVIAKTTTPTYKTASAIARYAETARTSKPYEDIYGYFRTLQDAKEEAAELMAKQAEDIKELEKAIKLIQKI